MISYPALPVHTEYSSIEVAWHRGGLHHRSSTATSPTALGEIKIPVRRLALEVAKHPVTHLSAPLNSNTRSSSTTPSWMDPRFVASSQSRHLKEAARHPADLAQACPVRLCVFLLLLPPAASILSRSCCCDCYYCWLRLVPAGGAITRISAPDDSMTQQYTHRSIRDVRGQTRELGRSGLQRSGHGRRLCAAR